MTTEPLSRHPDDDLLSRYAERTLLEPEAERVEGHVAACDDCRRLVAGLARAGVLPRTEAAPRGRILAFRWALAAAAGVLVAFGAWAAFRPKPPAEDADAVLVAAATDLAARRPDLFAGFRPLDAAERRGGSTDVLRGGLSLLLPAGSTISTKPDFSWTAVRGATSYVFKVLDAESGDVVVSETGSRTTVFAGAALTPWELARGKAYVWKVTAVGVSPTAEGTKAFTVASEADAAAFAKAREAIDALPASAPRALLLAHFAFRRGWLAEALDAASKAVAARGSGALERETFERVQRALGAPTDAPR
jgi:hypothetical protein